MVTNDDYAREHYMAVWADRPFPNIGDRVRLAPWCAASRHGLEMLIVDIDPENRRVAWAFRADGGQVVESFMGHLGGLSPVD